MKFKLLFLPLILLISAGIAAGQVTFPRGAMSGPLTVSALPLIGNSNLLYDVRDGNPDCGTGGGTTRVICHWTGATYEKVAAGSSVGNVTGPASSTDNAAVRFDLTTGKIIQNSGVIIDDNNNLTANNIAPGFATTATAAGTTVLTVASAGIQEFTGSTTQFVRLPVVTTLPQTGWGYVLINNSSDVVTVRSSGNNTIQSMAANTRATFTCKLLTGTTAASWNVTYVAGSGISGLTTNTLPKAVSAMALGDSRIVDNGIDINVPTGGALSLSNSVNLNGQLKVYESGTDAIQVISDDPGNAAFITNVIGDAQSHRFEIQVNGTQEWGDGTSIADVTLARTGAAALQIVASTESFAINGTAHTVEIESGNEYLYVNGATHLVELSSSGGVNITSSTALALTGQGGASIDGQTGIVALGNVSGISGTVISIDGTGNTINLSAASSVNLPTPKIGLSGTNAGSTGAQTINQASGSVQFAAAASSLVVTNSTVTANSIIIATVQTNDATLKSVQCVPAAGSFTMFGNAAAAGTTRVAFLVITPQ